MGNITTDRTTVTDTDLPEKTEKASDTLLAIFYHLPLTKE